MNVRSSIRKRPDMVITIFEKKVDCPEMAKRGIPLGVKTLSFSCDHLGSESGRRCSHEAKAAWNSYPHDFSAPPITRVSI